MKEHDEELVLSDEEETAVEPASPYNVRTGAMVVNGYSDFVPSPAAAEEMRKTKERYLREQMKKKLQAPKPVRVSPGGKDFISNKEKEEKEAAFSIRVRERAKEIYQEYRGKNKAFQEARQKILNATEDEIKDPSPELATAMELVELGRPMTKKLAVEMAEKELQHLNANYH